MRQKSFWPLHTIDTQPPLKRRNFYPHFLRCLTLA